MAIWWQFGGSLVAVLLLYSNASKKCYLQIRGISVHIPLGNAGHEYQVT